MPIMTRMRDSMPVILFGLLIAFLITIIFEWGMDYLGLRSGPSDVVGMVNDKKITYQQFSELTKNYADQQKAQTGNEPDENQLKQIREQVWQSLVTQHLVEEQITKLGLHVTDQELVNWVRGENPPEDLKRNFIDSTGQFRRDLYDQFLSNPNQFIRDPQGVDNNYGTKWLADYERNLRQRRMQEKLQSLVVASVRVSEEELVLKYKDQNQKYSAAFALFDPNLLIPDSAVRITDADLHDYYEENLDQYKFEATRKLGYVLFAETPSTSDTAASRNEIEDALQKDKAGIDFLQLVGTYSERPDSGAWFKHGEMNPELEQAVFSARVGETIGPIQQNDGFHLLKILDERKGNVEFVHASHILLSVDASKDTNAIRAKAQQVAKMAKEGQNFASLARQYSDDQGSAAKGGDLGWFGKGRMVPPFEQAAFNARPGEVVGPVRSGFGWHIIKVWAKDNREAKVASIVIPITASSQTKNDMADRAKDFAYNAKENDLQTEATATGLEVRESQVQEKGSVIPGIGINESIHTWAFNNKVGAVSDAFTVANGYAVFTITEAKEAGVKPFDEVKESLHPLVLRKLKLEKAKDLAADYRSRLAPGDSLAKLKELNPSINVQRTGEFTLGGTVPGIGRDMNVIGAMAGLEVGQLSQPVVGLRGAYLLRVLSKMPFDSTAFAAQKEVLRNQMLQDKKNRFLTAWLDELKEQADIEDHRDQFFR